MTSISQAATTRELLGACASLATTRVLLSQWIGQGDYSAEALKNDLLTYMDANDRLLVLDITGDVHADYNLM